MQRVVFLFSLLSLAWLALACAPKHPYVWANDLPPSESKLETIPLRSGDVVSVAVTGMEEELAKAGDLTVTADGRIVVPLIGPIAVAGQTPEAVAKQLNTRLSGIVQNPNARVTVVRPRIPVVAVVGEVNDPNRFEVQNGESILTVLAMAGGLTEFAKPNEIYVVRKYPSLTRIRFRYDDLVGGVASVVQFELRDGDVIVVR